METNLAWWETVDLPQKGVKALAREVAIRMRHNTLQGRLMAAYDLFDTLKEKEITDAMLKRSKTLGEKLK